jgi:DNA-binding protein H-NS
MPENADTLAVDIDRMTVPQLTALIAAAEAKRRNKLDDAKAALRAEMDRRAAELGISADDVFSTAGQQAPGEKAAANNGGARASRATTSAPSARPNTAARTVKNGLAEAGYRIG